MARYVAWNRRGKHIVGWLGYTKNRKAMERRLEAFDKVDAGVPKHVGVKKFSLKNWKRQLRRQGVTGVLD